MRIQITDDSDNKRINDWFTACCILYNMILTIDKWDDDDKADNYREDDEGEDGIGDCLNQKRTAAQKRERLVQRVLGQL